MRILHPESLKIVALVCEDLDFEKATVSRKQVISHAWSEILKYLATKQKHPKMWINDEQLGVYARIVKTYGDIVGCNLDEELLKKYDDVAYGYFVLTTSLKASSDMIEFNNNLFKFDNNYLFSDCTSLYFKGLNIFQYVYGSDWRRLVPIENLDEIYRVVGKTIKK